MNKNVLEGIGLIALGGVNIAFSIINAVETARAEERLIKMRKKKEELIECVNEAKKDFKKSMFYRQRNKQDLADFYLDGVGADIEIIELTVEGL